IAQQGLHARRISTDAGLARIEQLRAEWPAHLPLIDTLRAQYEHRSSHLGHSPGDADGEVHPGEEMGGAEEVDQELLEHYLIRRAVLGAERAAVLELRERGEIDDEVWRQIERDLDLEELRMDA